MRTLLRDITVIAMDDEHGSEPFTADVLIDGDRIAELAAPGTVARLPGDTVIAGRDRLVTPGLINAHLHSWEALFRGRYDNLPLELWMLLSYPILGLNPLPERLIHLRTLMVAIESLKNGVTCVLDDVIESPGQSLEALGTVFDAYEQAGIRANCSGNISIATSPTRFPSPTSCSRPSSWPGSAPTRRRTPRSTWSSRARRSGALTTGPVACAT